MTWFQYFCSFSGAVNYDKAIMTPQISQSPELKWRNYFIVSHFVTGLYMSYMTTMTYISKAKNVRRCAWILSSVCPFEIWTVILIHNVLNHKVSIIAQ